MHVLVDYDNAPVYRNQPVRLISDLVGLLTAIPVQTANFHFRLYGGWDTFGGVATPLAQTVSTQVQGALPYGVQTLPRGLHFVHDVGLPPSRCSVRRPLARCPRAA